MEEPYKKLDFTMTDLTPQMLEEARTVLKETNETKTKDLEELRNLIKKEKKLVMPMDDETLIPYLRSRKYDLKKAFKVVTNFWTIRRKYKHIYNSTDAEKVKEILFKNFIGFLPYRDKNGCAIVIFKLGQWNPDEDSYNDMFVAITAILLVSNKYFATQVCGFRIIVDCRGLSWQQMKMATPNNILVLMHSTQYCFPARYKGFHFISENKLFNSLWMIMSPILSSKLRQRMMLHGSDLQALQEYIHPSVLPEEFGGEAGPFDMSCWKPLVEENTNVLLDMLKYGYQD